MPAERVPESGASEGSGSSQTVAAKLVKLRHHKGLSQQQVAEMLGVSRQTISNWESAQGAPALDKAADLARIYGVSLDDLAGSDVEIVSTCKGEDRRDLHVLRMVRGCVCRIDCEDDNWVLSGGGATDVRVLDVDGCWMRLEYERRNPATLKKERVIQLVDTADVTCVSIVSGPVNDEGGC